jgi:hypothetical protein
MARDFINKNCHVFIVNLLRRVGLMTQVSFLLTCRSFAETRLWGKKTKKNNQATQRAHANTQRKRGDVCCTQEEGRRGGC